MRPHQWLGSIVALVLVVLGTAACGDESNDSTASNGASTAAGASASVQPPQRLADSGTISYCTFLTAPPLQYAEGGDLKGVNTEVGNALAQEMGLKADWQTMQFAGVITGLQAKRCDAILGQLYINPERKKMFSMLPFELDANQTVVPAGNPEHITGFESMQGKKVGVLGSSTYEALLKEQNEKFKAAGQPAIDIVSLTTAADVFQQVQAKILAAGGVEVGNAEFYVEKAGGTVEKAGEPFGRVKVGIAVRKDEPELYDALKKALDNLFADGTYQKIFKDAGLSTTMALPQAP